MAQTIPTIKASEANAYVGKLVFLKDSIRSGIIVADSVAVLKVGGKSDKETVSVVYLKKQHTVNNLDQRFITTLQHARAEFRGIVIPSTSGFIIIIDGADKGRNIILKGPFPEYLLIPNTGAYEPRLSSRLRRLIAWFINKTCRCRVTIIDYLHKNTRIL